MQNNNKVYTPTKKDQRLAIIITIFSILVLTGITYTFFSSAVSNTNNEKVQTQTATMSLEFDDGNNGVSASLNLGESITKKFTIENTGTVDAYGKINWTQLINTYTEESLSWTLEKSTSSNGTYTQIGSGIVPVSNSSSTHLLKDGLLVPINTTYYYKLTITLNNLNINQSSDLNAHMNSFFSLEAGKELPTGTKFLENMMKGENPNSTDVVDKTEYETVTRWVETYVDGDDVHEYTVFDTQQKCLDYISNHDGEQCIQKEVRQKKTINLGNYYIVTDEFGSTYNVFETSEECSTFLSNQNLESSYTCKAREIKIQNDYTNELAYDGTNDNNLRYVGENPQNYVTLSDYSLYADYYIRENFDGTFYLYTEDEISVSKKECLETINSSLRPDICLKTPQFKSLFRIIGAMNNIDDGTGNKSTRLKLISAYPLRQYSCAYTYQTYYGTTNDWTKSYLNSLLNEKYLDPPFLDNNLQSYCNNEYMGVSNNLDSREQELIGNAIWNLGGMDSDNHTASEFYSAERGNVVWPPSGQTCNDDACPRATEWTGKVALIYPSDIGFSMGGDIRTTCLSTNIRNYENTNCDSWIKRVGYTITPQSISSTAIYRITYNGIGFASATTYFHPTVYLNSNVVITEGNGSRENPYILELSY